MNQIQQEGKSNFTKYSDNNPNRSYNPAKVLTDSIKTPQPKPKSKLWRNLALIGNILWVSAITLMLVKLVAFQHVQVEGRSSYPNYDTGQYLLMNQIDKTYPRGQVVAVYAIRNFAFKVNFEMNPIESFVSRFDCNSPSDCPAKFYLKRVIGLPGECIEVKNYKTIIYKDNSDKVGQYLKESYINTSENRGSMQDSTRVCMDYDEYFLMGDNRGNSNDSRVLGKFKNFQIFGKELVRFQPVSEFRFFKLPEYEFLPVGQLGE
jgi:signal peptidase I